MKTLVLALLALALTGCYSFSAGSFPPDHITTIAVQPFENETTRFELSGELYDEILRNVPRALGMRTAGEDVADAVVRGSITRYEVVAPNYRSAGAGEAAQVLQRQVNIVVSVEIIDLIHALKKEKESFADLGIDLEEKAFYDILKDLAVK